MSRRFTLPEERALAGKANGLDVEPLSLGIDDDTLNSDFIKAKEVYESGGRFTNDERDRILARLYLGL